MREKVSFYFVLYLVALTALLAVTNERNIALREGKELVNNLVGKLYQKPVLNVPDSTLWTLKREGTVPVLLTGLDQSKCIVRYKVTPIDPVPSGTFQKEFASDDRGNGLFTGRIESQGRYRFRITAEVSKRLPDSLSQATRSRVVKVLGDSVLHLESDTTFVVNVTPQGPEPIQLVLSVEKPVSDRGFIGIPYAKTIYVNGADVQRVEFAGFDNKRFTLARGIGRIQLAWNNPERTAAPLEVTVRANSRQGFGAKDVAEAKFTLDIVPPRWNPDPPGKAFWGVPYQIASAVAGIDPHQYEILVTANGSLLKKVSPLELPDTVHPSSRWTSMTISAVSEGRELISKTIDVRKPDPPQQPRWRDQTLDGKDYVISFDCSDVNGDPVTVSLKVSQPEGLQSRLSATTGKSFTLRILNVTAGKPQAIEIQGSVQGLGGVRDVRKIFPIFY